MPLQKSLDSIRLNYTSIIMLIYTCNIINTCNSANSLLTRIVVSNSKTLMLTSFTSTSVLSPHPRFSVLNGTTGTYSLCWKRRFWQLLPTGHTSGWHSYERSRLRHLDSGPHGSTMSQRQEHGWISSRLKR